MRSYMKMTDEVFTIINLEERGKAPAKEFDSYFTPQPDILQSYAT